jgi:predicted RNA-binding Zn-ribbon protein involved in translation (DUF1610 family)
MPKAVCSSCGYVLRFSADVAGDPLECPECGEEIETRVRRGPPRRVSRAPDEERVTYQAPQTPSRVALGLGLASLIVGVMALPANWIPGFGKPALVVGAAALLLGLVGLGVAAVRQGEGLVFPIAGSAVALVAFGLSMSQLLGFLPGLAQPPPPVSVAEVFPRPMEPGPARPTDLVDADKALPAAPELPWFDVSKGPCQVGDVRLYVGDAFVGRVKQQDLEGQKESAEDYLTIQVVIENLAKTRKLDYTGWSSPASAVRLVDNFKNPYRRKEPDILGLAKELAPLLGGGREAKSIHPGERLEDLVIFERPVPAIKFLRLELPLAALGQTGTFRLQIPANLIRR